MSIYDDVMLSISLCRKVGKRNVAPEFLVRSDFTGSEAAIEIRSDLKKILVSFAGSNEFKDFVYDSKFHKDTIQFYYERPVRVHCGFSESEYSIHDKIQSRLSATLSRFPDYSVVLGGHSLGGSLLELFIVRYDGYAGNDKSEWSAFTFGKANTGNDIFVNWQNTNLLLKERLNFVNKDDLVPKLLYNRFGYAQSSNVFEVVNVGGEGQLIPDDKIAEHCNHDLFINYQVPISVQFDR